MDSGRRADTHSLAGKLTLWVTILFGLFLCVSVAGNLAAGRMIRARIHDLVLSNLEQTDVLLTSVLRKARDVGYVLSTNDYLVQYAELAPQPERRRYQEYQLVRELSLELAYRADVDPDIWSIYIHFADGGQSITSDRDFGSEDTAGMPRWIDVISSVSGSFGYIGHYLDEGLTKRHFLAVVTRADIVNRLLKSRVFVAANIDEIGLYATIDRLRATKSARVYLVDEANTVICAANQAELGKSLDSVAAPLAGAGGQARLRRVRLGSAGMHLVVQRRNDLTGWRFVVLLPERELLRGQRIFLAVTITLVSMASLVLAFLASRIVARNIKRPVATLVSFMERAEQKHFQLRIEHTRKDELGYLFDSFNGLVSRTHQLLEDLEQEHRLKREMELKLLQSRMNPHFLYNTLDTINWIAREHGVEDISRIVRGLSDLYRSMFNRGRDLIEVGRMVQSLEGYLYIQRFRYANLASYSFDVQPELRDLLVLNLVVQPVVENAVIHGMGGRVERGRIEVSAVRDGELLKFRVSDDGAGMSSQKLSTIRANMESDSDGEASGLRNVQRRLQLCYGPPCGVEIRSEEGRGTTVEIVMPARPPEKP